MKILMPCVHHKNYAFTLDDDVVVGGVELFQKLVYKNIPGIIPVYIKYEDRKTGKLNEAFKRAIAQHKPDVIFTNHFSKAYTVNLQKYGIPVVWLNHVPPINSIYNVESIKAMNEFTDNGGKLFFVGEAQHKKLNIASVRLFNRDLVSSGYINPAFCSGNEIVLPGETDLITIGRTDLTKKPFWLHSKFKKSGLNNTVITNIPLSSSDAQMEYMKANEHWTAPNTVFRGLDHPTTMDKLSRAKVYVSTCPVESWGITALEALSRGVPCLLVTDSTGIHGSQAIADRPSDYTLLRSSMKMDEVMEIVNRYRNWSFEQRMDLSERTKRKHNKENWIHSINQMFNGLSVEENEFFG